MERGMAFLIGAIGIIWLILDDFYGKGRVTSMANKIAEGAKIPSAGDIADGVIDTVKDNAELMKDKVENIPGAGAVVNGGKKVITDPYELGKEAAKRWEIVLGLKGDKAKEKLMEKDKQELLDLLPDFKLPDIPKFGALPALPSLPGFNLGGK
ncbi:hypothetical protein [Exiguobacterium sp. RIT452]|uniref:hypothetical protein n=1 Tax=Exiguobacterium sp. RIT452 TaxID=2315552 RepID=UPI0011C2300A|nr:hypothetical protein [Exiguobacterium sp. RIT452]